MKETRFKDTEIGQIPEEWEMKILGEICDFRNGYTPSKSINRYWENGSIPWFRMEDIRTNGRILSDSIQHITEMAVKDSLFPVGSIIISTTATIGEYALLIVDSLANQRFTNLTIRKSLTRAIDIMWFFHYCNVLGRWCRSNINEGGLAAVNMIDLQNILIPIPSTPEQVRIASALTSVDNLISSLDKLIEKKENIKQGTMQQLLTGKKRLKGFSDPWVERSIDEICNRSDNLRVPIAENLRIKGRIPYYGANGIQDYVEGYTHNGEFILIAEDGANSLSDYPIHYVKGKIWVNNHAHVLQAKRGIALNRFLVYALKTIDYESNIVGSGRSKLNSETMMNLSLKISSSIEEQTAIATVLTSMDDEISSLETKKAKFEQIKQGMMQQLLTGKIRLI